MERVRLDQYFSTEMESEEVQGAYQELRIAGREMAVVVNGLLGEGQVKADILGRLFRVVVDAELAVRMDGVNRTQNMIVMTKQ